MFKGDVTSRDNNLKIHNVLGLLPAANVPSGLNRGMTDMIRLPKLLSWVMKKPSDWLLVC